MNKIVKNALILAAITLIAGLLLGAAHQVTLEPIQKQQEKEKQELIYRWYIINKNVKPY